MMGKKVARGNDEFHASGLKQPDPNDYSETRNNYKINDIEKQ
jgi:hypothetical protein